MTYFKISGKFSLFTQSLKMFVRARENRVEHDFNQNVFKRTSFSFRESFNDFYYYFYYLLSCVCVCIALSCVCVRNIKLCMVLLFSEFPSKSKHFLKKLSMEYILNYAAIFCSGISAGTFGALFEFNIFDELDF